MKERREVLEEDKWNVGLLFPDLAAWEAEYKRICLPEEKIHWPELAAYQGRLSEGAETLKKFLDSTFEIDRKLSKLFTYSHLRYDEDLGEEKHKIANSNIRMIFHALMQELAWVEPEISALSKETIADYLKDERLKEYHFYLEKISRLKPHTLSAEKEELLAMAAKALRTSIKAFTNLNNVDLKFEKVEDSNKNLLEISHAKYLFYMRSPDRELRKNSFRSMHNAFLGSENTICELIDGHVQNHLFNKRARKYPTCLEAALFPNQIDPKVYHMLIDTVRKNLGVLHRYMALRKKALNLKELHLYDLYVPLVEDVDMKFDFNTAVEMVIDSTLPLGEEYQKDLARGVKEQRWVDRYENKRKRSGAYSSGCYDSIPYILMNFQGAFNDLMTLAHEVGHSMHSLLSHRNQPYQYSDYAIFVAEVASTFNEELMFTEMMSKNPSKKQKAFLLNQKIEDIRGTFFRQTMFAEFELFIHELAEKNIPLTPALLKGHYRELNLEYFGNDVVIDDEIDIEWARIPHFYNNFYVYQYATGISAAHALFENVKNNKEAGRKAYLEFLSSGCRHYPLDLLERAGVNMRQEEPIVSMITHFDRLVSELFELLDMGNVRDFR